MVSAKLFFFLAFVGMVAVAASDDTCGDNETFSMCNGHCEPTCELPSDFSCTAVCQPGCNCNSGLVRRKDGQCIPLSDC